MNVDNIIQHVFGEEFVSNNLNDSEAAASSEFTKSSSLELLQHNITSALERAALNAVAENFSTPEGKLGQARVKFDVATHVGSFVVGTDRLGLNSQSNFSSIRANSCVYKGKWQYEVQLGSKGVMQIGWATAKCKFSQEIGVGDTVGSFAFDGNRVRKWNITTQKYGEPWLSGDIIGCTLDMDEGVVTFYRNGRSLGVAFDSIPVAPNTAYFPAVSLAFSENLIANFGSTPFRYPVAGFIPLQNPPYEDAAKADLVFRWIEALLSLFPDSQQVSQKDASTVSEKACLMTVADHIFLHLGPLLMSPYIIEACVVPYISKLSELSSLDITSWKTRKPKLMNFFMLLWAFSEETEIRRCTESMTFCLLTEYRHAPSNLDYVHQRRSLLIFLNILQHERTRRFLLQYVLFDRIRFPSFVHVKPLDDKGLEEVVPETWWEGGEESPMWDQSKETYFASCKAITKAVTDVEALHVDVLKMLLLNSDGTPFDPSSRKIFLKKFRVFLKENIMNSKYPFFPFSQNVPLLQTPLPVTLCCFHRLLVAVRKLWDEEVGEQPITIPHRIFYDRSINYFTIDRVGGVLSHLNKVFKEDLNRALGTQPDEPLETLHGMGQIDGSDDPTTANIFSFPPGITTAVISGRTQSGTNIMIQVPVAPIALQDFTGDDPDGVLPESHIPAPPPLPVLGPASMSPRPTQRDQRSKSPVRALEPKASLIELLDGLIMFYHTSAHKQLSKVSTLRDNMSEYATALIDTKEKLKNCDTAILGDLGPKIKEELVNTHSVFRSKLQEQARHYAWVRAVVFSPEKQEHLAWLLHVVLRTFRAASAEGPLFSFVPDFYVSTLTELTTALRKFFHPTASLENLPDHTQLLTDVSRELASHFADSRIIHAETKDVLVQSLASFVCQPDTLKCLEQMPVESRLTMVRALLRPYENRAWAQSNWILVRAWQGHGFGFRYVRSPHLAHRFTPRPIQNDSSSLSQAIAPCPSEVFQHHISSELLESDNTTAFLNSLLNQLNWAFSEFIGMLQEIQNASNRPERVFIESRQLKICATCFDLALALMRVVEMIVSIAHSVFSDPARPSSEPLLTRLCQLLCQVLNRISSASGCFYHVVKLEIPGLECVDHYPVLSAVAGILIALIRPELTITPGSSGSARSTKALLNEPSFQMVSLHFLLGPTAAADSAPSKNKEFSLTNYPGDVTQEEIQSVRQVIEHLENFQKHMSFSRLGLSEDELCPICYAYPISATFQPCGHQSCRTCIIHHLMNRSDCFFCKANIKKVVDLDENLIQEVAVKEQPFGF